MPNLTELYAPLSEIASGILTSDQSHHCERISILSAIIKSFRSGSYLVTTKSYFSLIRLAASPVIILYQLSDQISCLLIGKLGYGVQGPTSLSIPTTRQAVG